MDLKETGYESVDWIRLAQVSDQWCALVTTVSSSVQVNVREFLDLLSDLDLIFHTWNETILAAVKDIGPILL
jgi:hypothetical protein